MIFWYQKPHNTNIHSPSLHRLKLMFMKSLKKEEKFIDDVNQWWLLTYVSKDEFYDYKID